VSWTNSHPGPFELSHHGLRIYLPCTKYVPSNPYGPYRGATSAPLDVALDCRYEDQPWTHISLSLNPRRLIPVLGQATRTSDNHPICQRLVGLDRTCNRLLSHPFKVVASWKRADLTIARRLFSTQLPTSLNVHITYPDLADSFDISSDPPEAWHSPSSILTLPSPEIDDLAPRAAIFINHKDAGRYENIVVIIQHLGTSVIGGSVSNGLKVGIVPRKRYHSLNDGFSHLDPVPCWAHRNLSITQSKTAEVSMQMVSAAGETL
jgi:hypothetical protein